MAWETHCMVRHNQSPAYPDSHVVNCIHSPWKGKARRDPWDQFWPCRRWCSCTGFWDFYWGTYGSADLKSGKSSTSCRWCWKDVSTVRHLHLSHCRHAQSVNEPTGSSLLFLLRVQACLPHSRRCLILETYIRLFGATTASSWTSAILQSSSRGQQVMLWHLLQGCQLLRAWNNGTKNNGKRTVHNNASSIVLDSL